MIPHLFLAIKKLWKATKGKIFIKKGRNTLKITKSSEMESVLNRFFWNYFLLCLNVCTYKNAYTNPNDLCNTLSVCLKITRARRKKKR